ncbi:MAG: hypothetical protein JWM76_2938 [Pseudonocardiales bacterium]|nr:hypothetical protein [Pseudonocardiales bacterium]
MPRHVVRRFMFSGLVVSTAMAALVVPAQAATTLTLTSTGLPAGAVSAPYSATLAASGGTQPYSWKLVAGGVPTGLKLSTAGVISGTPTAKGTWSLTPRVTDAAGHTAQRALSLKITASAVSVTTTTLPGGYLGTSYSTTLAASGGTTPYKWKITAGGLPDGLTLNQSGVISGVPTRSGKWSLTVAVTDAGGISASKALTLKIAALVDTTLGMSCPGATFAKTTTCTLTATNNTSGPAPTGGISYQLERGFLGSCTLPTGTTGSSNSCTVQINWPDPGTYTFDLNYDGDGTHNASDGGADIAVAKQTGGLDSVGSMICPGAQNFEDSLCTITITNAPASSTPAPTGTADFEYFNEVGLPDGQTCTLTSFGTHSSSCQFEFGFEGVPGGITVHYFGDSTHRATATDTTLQTGVGSGGS